MTQNDNILTTIADEHLGIPTLETRRSDSLDFYNVAVWQAKAALAAAFDAGRQSTIGTPPRDPNAPAPFDGYEIHGVRSLHSAPGTEQEPRVRVFSRDWEQVPDADAQFWTLFGHIPGQGLDAIGDFATREHAEQILARISGRQYEPNRRPLHASEAEL